MRITFGLMNAMKVITAALFLSIVGFMSTSKAISETVIIFDRFFVDRTSIAGNFHQNKNGPVTLEIAFGVGLEGKVYKIICPEYDWDWGQIKIAIRSLVKEINENANIDVFKTLKDSGFNNCKFN